MVKYITIIRQIKFFKFDSSAIQFWNQVLILEIVVKRDL